MKRAAAVSQTQPFLQFCVGTAVADTFNGTGRCIVESDAIARHITAPPASVAAADHAVDQRRRHFIMIGSGWKILVERGRHVGPGHGYGTCAS